MNTATKITFARIFLTPVVVAAYLIVFPYNKLVACALFVLVVFTDSLDGYIARSRNQVTDLGKFMDPIADKIIVVVMLFVLVGDNTLGAWWDALVCGVIISREFIISGFRLIAKDKKIVIAADVWGKIKTVLFDIGIAALMIGNLYFTIFGKAVLYAGTIISVYSCINYIAKSKGVFVVTKAVVTENVAAESDKTLINK